MAGSKQELEDYPQETLKAWAEEAALRERNKPAWTLGTLRSWLTLDAGEPSHSLPYLKVKKFQDGSYQVKYRTADAMRAGGLYGVILAIIWFPLSVAALFGLATTTPMFMLAAPWLMSIISLGGSIILIGLTARYWHLTRWPMVISGDNTIRISADSVEFDSLRYQRPRISLFQYRTDEKPANSAFGLTMRLGFRHGSVMIYGKEAVFSEIEAENVVTILNEIMLETGPKGYARPEPGYTPSFTSR